jgi:hypothetical protein
VLGKKQLPNSEAWGALGIILKHEKGLYGYKIKMGGMKEGVFFSQVALVR